MKNNFLFVLILAFISCKEQEGRRPIQATPSVTIYEAVKEESKIINEIENKKIEYYIQQDSLATYINSSYGFWYKYNIKTSEEKPTPAVGDALELSYEIKNLTGEIIYSKEELGVKTLKIGNEDFISALQDGIKLMKVGENITFAIPSYKAFGISGDKNRIGINQSLIVTVTLINIKQKNENY